MEPLLRHRTRARTGDQIIAPVVTLIARPRVRPPARPARAGPERDVYDPLQLAVEEEPVRGPEEGAAGAVRTLVTNGW
jgi:hypothetical protein